MVRWKEEEGEGVVVDASKRDKETEEWVEEVKEE